MESSSVDTPSIKDEKQLEEMETDEDTASSEIADDVSKDVEPEIVSIELKKAPPYNCKEKIVFFIDISSDMKSDSLVQGRTNRSISYLQVLKRTLQMFLATKRILNADHEYAVVPMKDNLLLWLQGFTNDFRQISELIEDFEAGDKSEDDRTSFNFDQVVSLLQDNCDIPEVDDLALPPPFVLRAIFIYGRSNCELTMSKEKAIEYQKMKSSPYFFLDVLYIHELPSADNSAQAIYDFFCNLDKEEKGYILDVTNGVKILYETVAKLICHPLQRSPQNEAYHNLTSASPEQSAAERP